MSNTYMYDMSIRISLAICHHGFVKPSRYANAVLTWVLKLGILLAM